jgi:hypothetical protein
MTQLRRKATFWDDDLAAGFDPQRILASREGWLTVPHH